AHAAHSGLTLSATPKTEEPGEYGWSSACARAATTGSRCTEAIATAALSMMRLMLMSVTSSSTGTRSAAREASLYASCSSRGSSSSLRWVRRGWEITEVPFVRAKHLLAYT